MNEDGADAPTDISRPDSGPGISLDTSRCSAYSHQGDVLRSSGKPIRRNSPVFVLQLQISKGDRLSRMVRHRVFRFVDCALKR
jgi:hypothetical protein